MSHLSSGKVNLAQVRETSRRELLNCIDKCPGSKAIIWDDKLTGPVGLIAEYSLLKEHDVGRMLPLGRGQLPMCEEQNIIFLVRPKVELMDIIAENIPKKEINKEYHIFFVPRKSFLCEQRLEELKVYGNFTNKEQFPLSLVPFDHDLLSMEYERSLYECYIERDLTSMYYVTESLMKLQALFGVIPKIFGKGEMAHHVADMIIRKRRELADTESQITPVIDSLLLIDRNVDLLTPLLTQLTYEGLIDEIFTIENTNVQLPADRFPVKEEGKGKGASAAKDPSKPRKIILNSGDLLYSEIRDINFSGVGPVLSREAKRITAQYEEHRSAKTVGEMKEFVHKIPHIQAAKSSLALHTSIAEVIKEQTDSEDFRESLRVEQEFFNGIDTDKMHAYIDRCISTKQPLTRVLRLICLQCIANNGFKAKLFDYYRREIINAYGFEHLLTLSNLEQVGLLKAASPRSYATVRKSLGLVVDDVHEQAPNDIAYTYSGYAPLSVRLAQFLSRPSGWHGLDEVLRQLPGPTVEEVQYVPPALLKKGHSGQGGGSIGDGPSKVTLVYFLGGCTHAEVSALRFLAQQENFPSDFVIATTKLINAMSGPIDVTSPSLPTNKSSMTWNHVLLASGTEQVQLSLDSISQVLLQTSEDGVIPPDVVIAVEKSDSPVNITDQFNGALDESVNHENCEGESDVGTVQQHVTTKKKGRICPSRKYHNWSEYDMEEAVTDVIAGKCSAYAAAIMHNVPKSSLQNRVKKAKGSEQRSERTIKEARSGKGRIDASLGRISEDEIAMYCSSIESLKSAKANSNAHSSIADNVDIMDGSNFRKYRWKEEDAQDALKADKGRSLSSTMTGSHYGITSLDLRDPLHRKAKMNHADGVPETGRRRPRSKGTRWNEEDIEKAIAAINKEGLSIRKAALCFGIPKSSLCDRLNGKQKIRQRFALTEEKVLAENMSSGSENLTRRKDKMVKSKTKNGSKSREKLVTANKYTAHLKSKLGDEVQVHIIDEEVVIDGRYDQSFEIRENERCGGRRAFSYEQSEEEQEDAFTHEEATTRPKGGMPELDSVSEKFEMLTSSSKRSGHLSGRITMTDEDIDRKEVLSTSARSWTQREMDDAIRDVRDNGLSIRKAAGKHHIPKSSLADRISKQKCMKARIFPVIGRLVTELRPLAKTQEDVQRLKELENGRLAPKAVAKRLGMSYACLKKILSDDDENGTGLGDLQSELETGLFQGGEEENGDRTQPRATQDQHNFCTRAVEEDSQAGAHLKVRRARLCWKRDNLDQAIAAVREGRMSLRGSSKMYGIPKSTLGDILRGKSAVGSNSRGSQLLSDDEEASIAGWLVTMARAGRRVRVKEVLETVKAILDRKGTTVPRLKDNMPKDSWWYGFLGRHKEVAEIRRQSKADVGDFTADIEDIDSPEKEDEAVEYAPDKVTVLPAEQQYLVNSAPAYLHSNFAIESLEDDESCLCSICGTARVTGNVGEQWISCGAVNNNGTQIEGCGGWSHLVCTNLGQRNLSAEELRDISWRCPKCVE